MHVSGLRPSKAASFLLALFFAAPTLAQEFAVEVTPPRFEDSARPGTVYRNVIEINNTSAGTARLAVRTADWSLNEQGSAEFDYGLVPGSCRPWVGIEASEVSVPSRGRKRFRFEVDVPADAPSGECRFGLMIEGEPALIEGGPPVPVAARIGIIVYLAIGDAAPALEVVEVRSAEVGGSRVPVLRIRNSGNAHGRLQGFIESTDASGRRITWIPSSSPILAGDTRDISLHALAEGDEQAPEPVWPLRIRGRLDAGKGRVDVDAEVGASQ
ncbi:hypothetical protein [Arenimonas sp.]|uniref:hypothetical protein n=1 Tax=Arenimonas sp. TaxID=1872635 RepID=UPI0025E20D0F|nr:hypothetical protein [Arenimonas sp.]